MEEPNLNTLVPRKNDISKKKTATPAALENAKKFIAHRFPKLKGAPLVEHRICPYENSPDGNFVFDKHPEHSNVFLLGGGSGHGFKHGPALGELVAEGSSHFCLDFK